MLCLSLPVSVNSQLTVFGRLVVWMATRNTCHNHSAWVCVSILTLTMKILKFFSCASSSMIWHSIFLVSWQWILRLKNWTEFRAAIKLWIDGRSKSRELLCRQRHIDFTALSRDGKWCHADMQHQTPKKAVYRGVGNKLLLRISKKGEIAIFHGNNFLNSNLFPWFCRKMYHF